MRVVCERIQGFVVGEGKCHMIRPEVQKVSPFSSLWTIRDQQTQAPLLFTFPHLDETSAVLAVAIILVENVGKNSHKILKEFLSSKYPCPK
jgi:hypothetical protein